MGCRGLQSARPVWYAGVMRGMETAPTGGVSCANGECSRGFQSACPGCGGGRRGMETAPTGDVPCASGECSRGLQSARPVWYAGVMRGMETAPTRGYFVQSSGYPTLP